MCACRRVCVYFNVWAYCSIPEEFTTRTFEENIYKCYAPQKFNVSKACSWKSERLGHACSRSWILHHCKVHCHTTSLTDKGCEVLLNPMLTHETSWSFFSGPVIYSIKDFIFYFNLLCGCFKEKVLVHELWNSDFISIITVACLTVLIKFVSWILYYFRCPCFHTYRLLYLGCQPIHLYQKNAAEYLIVTDNMC